MTQPPTMPDIRILTRSISEEWEDLLLGAYTDPERAETDRLRYLAAIGVQDPWQERRHPRRNAAHRHALRRMPRPNRQNHAR